MPTVVPSKTGSPSIPMHRGRHGGRWAALLIAALVSTSVVSAAALVHPEHPDQPVLTAAGTSVSGIRQTVILGYSRQHRPIVAYEMGNPAAPFKTVVLGSMHGYWERAGEQVVAAIRTLPVSSSLDLWVIPTMNPDGDALHQRGNQAGVDLNRNFPVGWAYIPPSSDKFDSHYSGPHSLSEPESQAMYKFLTRIKPNRMVSMHQPLDAVDTTDGGARDVAFRNALSANLGLPASPLTCWSQCHGSMTRWLTATQKGAAITVEFPQNVSAGYLSGRAARGILGALAVGVKPPVVRMIGNLDTVRTAPFRIAVTGWVLDPQRRSTPGIAVVSVDGRAVKKVNSNGSRPDVNRLLEATGGHGFAVSIAAALGRHRVCVTAAAAAGTSVSAPVGTCRVITVPAYTVQGHLDLVQAKPKLVRVRGWALDPLHPTVAGYVQIMVDGRAVTTVHTLQARADVNRVFHATGTHGFDVGVAVAAGRHSLSVVPVPKATTSIPRALAGGPITITVPAK